MEGVERERRGDEIKRGKVYRLLRVEIIRITDKGQSIQDTPQKNFKTRNDIESQTLSQVV